MRLVLLIVSMAFTAGASVIVPPGIFSNVAGNSSVNTPVPGNNNHPGGNSPNTVTINEVASSVQTLMGVSFNVINDSASGGRSTEYAVTKTVLNNTGQTWTSFEMSLNYQFLNGQVFPFDFVVVQFDLDAQPTLSGNGTSGQNLSSNNTNQLTWGGINVLPGDSITINFSVDTCPSCDGIWQLSQLASGGPPTADLPEPAMTALIGIGLVAIGLRTKFYKSKSQ
jgi:hypothetical protein